MKGEVGRSVKILVSGHCGKSYRGVMRGSKGGISNKTKGQADVPVNRSNDV